MSQYEIAIDGMDSIRKLPKRERYLYSPNQIDWRMMEQLGLDRKTLEENDALTYLLKGFKTPMLLPIRIKSSRLSMALDARVVLRLNTVGILEPYIFPIRKAPDFIRDFRGYQFTKADQYYLKATGNMGRIVELIHPITKELIPSLISRDRLTNDLIAYNAVNIKIPSEVKGVVLNQDQRHNLKVGKIVFLQNMRSNKGEYQFSSMLIKLVLSFCFRKN